MEGEFASFRKVALINIDTNVNKLQEFYREIGVPESEWPTLIQRHWASVVGVSTDLVEDQRSRVRQLTNKVEEVGRKLLDLAGQLQQPVPEPDDNLSLLQLDGFLQQHCDRLIELRRQKLDAIQPLKEREGVLCTLLGVEPLRLAHEIPNDEDMRELQEQVARLDVERDARLRRMKAARLQLVECLEFLERAADGTLENDMVHKSSESFGLTASQLTAVEQHVGALQDQVEVNLQMADRLRERLTSLYDRLETPASERFVLTDSCGHKLSVLEQLQTAIGAAEQLRSQHMDTFIDKLRVEIQQVYGQLYYSDEQRRQFAGFEQTEMTESLLEQHEQELERVRQFQQQHREVFRHVDDYQQLWQRMLHLEERGNQPDRFVNRGGNLLAEEKERRAIERRLPKLQKELQMHVQRHQDSSGLPVTVYGMDVVEFLESQVLDRQRRKEQEREDRAAKKKNQLHQETMFGSRPATPSMKRRLGVAEAGRGTPASKLGRLESTRLLSAASPMPARTPLSPANHAARAGRLGRTAPGKLTTDRNLNTTMNMTDYSEFARGLQRMDGVAKTSAKLSPAFRKASQLRRRSQRLLAGLPPASPALRTPRALQRLVGAPSTAGPSGAPRRATPMRR